MRRLAGRGSGPFPLMLSIPRAWIWWMAMGLLCLLCLSGCAPAKPVVATDKEAWSGRIALLVEGQASQSFSALFELQGNANRGGLVLLSPLGNRVAQLDWKDGHAQLVSGQENRTSDSLEALLQDVTGTRIPVEALFHWLRGTDTVAAGWQADLSGMPEGRLIAHRNHPAPPTTLRIALTR